MVSELIVVSSKNVVVLEENTEVLPSYAVTRVQTQKLSQKQTTETYSEDDIMYLSQTFHGPDEDLVNNCPIDNLLVSNNDGCG